MVHLPFLFTIFCLSIYSIYSYLNRSAISTLHCLYTICLIIYNSRVSQSDARFVHLHPGPIAEPSQNQDEVRKCPVCKKVKPPRYYHCRRCNLCIYQMDHHCDWLNCCVGQFNFKMYFHILLNLFIVACGSFMEVFGSGSWLNGGKILRFVITGFLIWQVGRMGSGAFQMVIKNQTLIQTYKKVRGPRKTWMNKLIQIFGSPIGISWFIPSYTDSKLCDTSEKSYPTSKKAESELKEYVYADQYLYGSDEDDSLSQPNDPPPKQE